MHAVLRIASEPVGRLGQWVIDHTARLGQFTLFSLSFFFWLVRPPYRLRLLIAQMEFIGYQSISIIVLTSLFFGMIMALQGSYVAFLFNVQGMVGMSVAMASVREGSPVLTALMIIGRCGSAMAAELGTMRVTEQVDALDSMAVSPVQYLVVPRVVAGILMLPVLTILSDVLSVFGGYIVMVIWKGVDSGIFFGHIQWFVDPLDIYSGLMKAMVFGLLMTLIGCFMGFTTSGGAKGVGTATTRAVVVSSVTIMIADYFLSNIIHLMEVTNWTTIP